MNINTDGLIKLEGRHTVTKTRVLAGGLRLSSSS